MLVHSARRILGILKSVDLPLGVYRYEDWKAAGIRFDAGDAWDEISSLPPEDDETHKTYAKWYRYLEHVQKLDASEYRGGHFYLEPLPDVPTWYMIRDPCIYQIILPDTKWQIEERLLDGPYIPAERSKGYKCDDILWELSKSVDSFNHSIHVSVKSSLYVPKGLHVFKPLAPDLFGEACKELYKLYMDEDIRPTGFFSPDRVRSDRTDVEIPAKTMLVYTTKRDDEKGGMTYAYPQQTIGDTLYVLRQRGYSKLADFAEKHVRAMVALTGSSYTDLQVGGGIMFLRYAPGEGFRPHIDGTAGLGHSPGPILNVTMGLEGEKVFDMMPATCWRDAYKTPIRVTTKPGEGILMWSESRVAWTHCIPVGDNTWRYTMAIKLLLNASDVVPESGGMVTSSLPYDNYKLNLDNVVEIDNSDNSMDVKPPPDLVYISNCVTFDARTRVWKYILPRGMLECVNTIQHGPLLHSEYDGPPIPAYMEDWHEEPGGGRGSGGRGRGSRGRGGRGREGRGDIPPPRDGQGRMRVDPFAAGGGGRRR